MTNDPVSRLRRLAQATTALAGTVVLSACLGTGGKNSSGVNFIGGDGFREGGGGLPIATYDADPEYQAMSALGTINASTYYNGGSNPTGYTGSGVIVAVIDSGIDVNHPEFQGALHPDSRSVVSGSGGSVADVTGHGTYVAGVVGANRDGNGMHGVAFNSTILAIAAETCFGALCGFFDTDLIAATDFAVSRDADVINYSLGGPSPSSASFRASMIGAVNNDTILVASAGNAGGVDPLYPALDAIDPALDGQMIVAGAYDEGTGLIAGFSNRAGLAQDYFLMAPGVSVYTTRVGGGYTFVDGTSFSAPIISGAAALLRERFPLLLAEQIVDILLVSATDLGAAGTDAIYGRGLLNMAAAAAPLGVLTIPSTALADGAGSDPADTTLALSAAFGDALSGSSVLAGAIFLDGYGRDYGIDLTASIATPSSGPDILGFLSGDSDIERFETALTPSTRLRVQGAGTEEGPQRWLGAMSEEAASDASFSLRQQIAEGADLTVARGQGAAGQFGLYGAGAPVGGGMLGASDMAFIGMADSGGNATLSTAFGDSVQFRVGVGVNDAALGGETEGSADDASVYIAEMSHTGRSGLRLGIQLGRLVEDGSLLESGGDGGFGLDGSATTDFVSAFGVVPLTGMIDLFGSYTSGRSDADSLSTDLIAGFDGVRSESMGFGIAARDVISDRDRVTLSVMQPLRVTEGTAIVTAPHSRALDGAVNHAQETVGLSPSGRETDAELTYRFSLGPSEQIDFSIVTRFEPDHVQDASPELSAGVRYRLTF